MELSKTQKKALNDALNGENMFITGPGGVGKSFLIHTIKDELKKAGKNVALTSSTGISAVNIGGQTIHSFCMTGLRGSSRELKTVKPEYVAKMRQYNSHIDTIIVDEVSMLSGDYIDMIDSWFQRIWKTSEGFGGRQMIFVGDMLQLPPVIKEQDFLQYHFAFQSEAWDKYIHREHFLTKVFRQEDKKLQYYLNCIRFGKINDDVLDYFNSRVGVKLEDPNPTVLYPLKRDVSSLNFKKLDELKEKEWEYEAWFTGDERWGEFLMKNTLAEPILYLKKGAPVLFIRNNKEAGYYNGLKGTVIDCDEKKIIVETLQGEVIDVEREVWEKTSFGGEVLAAMSQYPLILGWSLSIHKSQGLTLDWMQCDLSKCFEGGQSYVALSRIRNIEGLSLEKPMTKKCIKVHKEVMKYYRNLYRKLKEENINTIQ